MKYISILVLFVSTVGSQPIFADDKSQVKNYIEQKDDSSFLLDYTITHSIIHKGVFDEEVFVHSHAAAIPGRVPILVLTTQKKITRGVDAFYSRFESTSNNLGKTWAELVEIPSTRREIIHPAGDKAYADSTPQWHAVTGSVLSIGVIIPYGMRNPWGSGRTDPEPIFPDFSRPRKIAYMVRLSTGQWSKVKMLKLPSDFAEYHAPASSQRYDLGNGNILLPVCCQRGDNPKYICVLECRFDGKLLEYIRQGHDIRLPGSGKVAGLAEPSLTYFQNQYFMTLRNQKSAYVTISKDGLNFVEPKIWRWNNGEPIDSYSTQQHWVTHSDGLFLVYTRRGVTSKGIFNSRAPLYIAKVDPDRLCVIKSTERVLFPNKGYPLGNFGVTTVNEKETIVITTEWPRIEFTKPMLDAGNDILMARIKWNKPNRYVARGMRKK